MAAVEREIRRPAPPPPAGRDGIRAAARGRNASPRQVLLASLFGALVLSLLAAPDLPDWAQNLADGPLTPLLREAAYRWDNAISALGLALPARALRLAVTRFKHFEWP